MYTATELNAHLAGNGMVQITTYTRSTVYTKKHAGWFLQGADGNLYVRSGNTRLCLSYNHGQATMVGIRLGRYQTPTEAREPMHQTMV